MSGAADTLFRPFTLGGLSLPNRIVMAPMTRLHAPDGIVDHLNAAYYRRRAEGGVGLILSEGTVVDRPASRNHPEIPKFHGNAALAGWQNVIGTVHAAGGKMGPQLWHTGATISQRTDWRPPVMVESPSGLNAPGEARGTAMDDRAITDTIAAFASAAAAAKAMGCDVVELHGAHGYLIDQFFWNDTNRRIDNYGGSLRSRTRFAAEVVKAVRLAVGPGFPVLFRISQWKQQDYAAKIATSPDELMEWLAPLADAGVDIFHCSQRRFWDAEFPSIDGEGGLNLAGWVKKLLGTPTISVGSVGLSGDFLGAFNGLCAQPSGLERLIDRMERDEFDLIAVGRALIANADWPVKIRLGALGTLGRFDAEMLDWLN